MFFRVTLYLCSPSQGRAAKTCLGTALGSGGLDDSSSALSKGAVDPALLGGGIAAGVFLLVLVALLVYAVFYTHDNVAGISEDRDADRRASMGVMLQDGPQSLHYIKMSKSGCCSRQHL